MTKMTKNYKILSKYIKDLSSEIPDIETYLYRETIYQNTILISK